MRRYETIVIMDPDLPDEQRQPVVQRVQDVINQENGYLALTDEWGIRKLAYEIKKKPRGYYTRFDFCGTSSIVDEIERFFRIDDRVLKYMTVLLDKYAEVEKVKEEIASSQKAVEAPPEVSKPTDTQAPSEKAEPAETQAPEEPPAAVEGAINTREEPVDADPSQKLEPQADEGQAAENETKEERK
ncbi:MAG: 30S ribosomal protein S6 [Desulfobacterales bacterium]|jgi:small subunit ribosomal protein S6